jgi:hypothetical protein
MPGGGAQGSISRYLAARLGSLTQCVRWRCHSDVHHGTTTEVQYFDIVAALISLSS